MLSKDIPIFALALLSAQRSDQLYVEVKALEKPQSADQRHSRKSDVALTEQADEMTASDHSVKQRRTVTETFKSLAAVIKVWLNLASPFLFQGAIFRRAGITSGSAQAKLKKAALKLGLIIEHKLQFSKTMMSVWEPKEKAYQMAGIPRPQYRSKGGYLHQFMAHHVKQWAVKSGYKVEIEFVLANGKAVDLMLCKGDELIFIEIAISPPLEKEIMNIVKDCDTDLKPDQLRVLVKDRKTLKKLDQMITSDNRLAKYREKIQLELAGEYVGRY